jgi:uncharacterized phage protein gp47/JayE
MGTGLLTATGFDPKRLEDVIAGLQVSMRTEFGQSLNLGDDTPEGKFVDTLSAALTELWERLEAVDQSQYPAGASGVSLDRVAELTGISRRDAIRSTGTAYLRGTGATVPTASVVEVIDTGDQFRTVAEAIIPAGGAIALSAGTADIAITTITRVGTVASVTTTAPHGQLAGAVVTISGANETPYNVTAIIENVGASSFDYNMVSDPGGSATGTLVYQEPALAADHIVLGNVTARSTAAHGLTTGDYAFIYDATEANYNGVFPVTVIDTTHFTYAPLLAVTSTPATGTSVAAVATPVVVEAVLTGPIQALAGTLTEIVTPVSGWDGVDSNVAVTIGEDEETDAAFRIRRLAALQGLGNATLDAIRGDVLSVEGVLSVTVFENATDVAVSSRPPHSIEVLVDGGVDATLAQAIWDSKAGGIATFGSANAVAVDSQGNNQTMSFSRPIGVPIYLDITLTVDADYPVDGDAQVETAVLAWAAALSIGDDVIVYPYLVGSFTSIPGVLTVVIDIGIAPGPSGDANIVIAETSRATFSAANTTVTS